jgi:hypothetical protein
MPDLGREARQLIVAEVELFERREASNLRRKARQLVVTEIQRFEKRELSYLGREGTLQLTPR